VALFEHQGYRPGHFFGRSGRPAKRWEHGIVVRYFPVEFVHKKKLVDWRLGLEVRRIYEARVKADYRPDVATTSAMAQNAFMQAQALLTVVGRLL
jgi:hypothetical protein